MRVFLCTLPPPPPPPQTTIKHHPFKTPPFIQSLTTAALSVTLFFTPLTPFTPPLSLALDNPSSGYPTECREEDKLRDEVGKGSEMVSNEEIVNEAWQIVNEGFLGSDTTRWSPELWLRKKDDIMSRSLPTRSKAHDVIRRMLSSLGDPYTRFLSPEEFSKMSKYDTSGIGVNLREIPDENGEVKLKVLGLILDGPAYAAGVRQGDELLSVNGVDMKGKSAFEALSIIQGPSDTSVNIMVKHGNCGPVQSVDVQRQLIAKTPVFYRLEQMDNGKTSVGYVRLKEFNALARKDLVTAMKRLQGMGASVFVLDLRDNLGGLVQEGIEIAKLFLNKGETVIYTAGREPQNVKSIVAETGPLITNPVIVLVNKNTASASEIVATALHDNCRAILVGEKTYGKGLIQSVFELHDGSGVVVTVGKYVTPNHLDINGNGVDPDYKKFPAWNEVAERLSKCHKLQG
nr:carboxyl-terminal-processing peptidase 1, chloroplastic [Tanacetum cinerariifolium]